MTSARYFFARALIVAGVLVLAGTAVRDADWFRIIIGAVILLWGLEGLRRD